MMCFTSSPYTNERAKPGRQEGEWREKVGEGTKKGGGGRERAKEAIKVGGKGNGSIEEINRGERDGAEKKGVAKRIKEKEAVASKTEEQHGKGSGINEE